MCYHSHHQLHLDSHYQQRAVIDIEHEMLFWSRVGWLCLLLGLTVCFILVVG